MPDAEEEKPDWWRANDEIKAAFDLPEYEPPRFEDGTHVYRVVEPLENEYGVEISFAGFNTRYPDDWTVRIDREPVMAIGHRRDENGNTVYLKGADEFREALVEKLES